MRLEECLRVINRRLRSAEAEVARRKRLGLQTRPWQHRVEELLETREEIAALAAPKKAPEAAGGVRTPDRSSRREPRSLRGPDQPPPSS